MSEAEGLQRGGLFGNSALDRAIALLTERAQGLGDVNIPDQEYFFEELAWNFNGTGIKDLKDCTKEELLHVCQVLVRKVSPVSSDKCCIRGIS